MQTKLHCNFKQATIWNCRNLILLSKTDTDRYLVEVPATQLWSPLFNYKIIVENIDGNTSTFPETGFYEAEVVFTEQIDTQQIPPLLITEITPDTKNLNKLDGYEFIEIYNNTNQPINMKDYKIIYRYPAGSSSPEQHWNLTDDKIIEPRKALLFGFITKAIKIKRLLISIKPMI